MSVAEDRLRELNPMRPKTKLETVQCRRDSRGICCRAQDTTPSLLLPKRRSEPGKATDRQVDLPNHHDQPPLTL